MSVGVIDTTVLIHIFRGSVPARTWFASQKEKLSTTTINCLEFLYGAPNNAGMTVSVAFLEQLETLVLSAEDQEWAVQQMRMYRLSKGIFVQDCLIASVCHWLQIPIYTTNLKDMRKVLPDALVVEPYTT